MPNQSYGMIISSHANNRSWGYLPEYKPYCSQENHILEAFPFSTVYVTYL